MATLCVYMCAHVCVLCLCVLLLLRCLMGKAEYLWQTFTIWHFKEKVHWYVL